MEEENADLKAVVPGDGSEAASNGDAHLDVDGEGIDPLAESGDMGADQLLNIKHNLEEKISKLNMDIKNKNEKILDLLENIEDLKVALYSRDKTIELLEE